MHLQRTDGSYGPVGNQDSSVIELEVLRTSRGAVLFLSPDGEEEAWIPRAVIYRGANDCVGGEKAVVEIYDWKLKERGW